MPSRGRKNTGSHLVQPGKLAGYCFNGRCMDWEILADVDSFSFSEAMLLWSAPRITTSGQVQHQKSAIHGFPVTLCMLRVRSDKSDWSWSHYIVLIKPTGQNWSLTTYPEVVILGVDQKEHGLWGQE